MNPSRPGSPQRLFLVRRDSDRECHRPPNGSLMPSLRVRVLVENRPTLPLRLARRLDRFNASGPSLMRFLKPQLMSGVSTCDLAGLLYIAVPDLRSFVCASARHRRLRGPRAVGQITPRDRLFRLHEGSRRRIEPVRMRSHRPYLRSQRPYPPEGRLHMRNAEAARTAATTA